MDDNQFLSQEEIEALIKGSSSEDADGNEANEESEHKEVNVENIESEQEETKEGKVEKVESEQTYKENYKKTKGIKKEVSSSKKQSSGNGKSNLDLILDIPLELSVILGNREIELSELLGMNSGTLIELDKLVDEQVEIYVNKKLLARGEIVAIDENYGVRITDIIKPVERLKTLK